MSEIALNRRTFEDFQESLHFMSYGKVLSFTSQANDTKNMEKYP